MPTITIAGTPIDFPNSGSSPNWAPEVIRFAQAVEAALEGVVGPFDVLPQFFTLTGAHNPTSSPVEIVSLSFPVANVRSFIMEYDVFRETDSTQVTESGTFWGNYNEDGPTGDKWDFSLEKVGDADITFDISDTGQVSFETTAIAGTGHTGRINFRARAFANAS